MCYYRLVKFTCSCPTCEIWISYCSAPIDGPSKIEGVPICKSCIAYVPCPQPIQHICMKCFKQLGIGHRFVAGSHFPDVLKKVKELDHNQPPRNWEWLVNATKEQFDKLVSTSGEVPGSAWYQLEKTHDIKNFWHRILEHAGMSNGGTVGRWE